MLLIQNGTIITMDKQNFENGCVLIEKGKIKQVAEHIPSDGCRVIDAQGGWVLPGLIEAHCHIGISEETIGSEGNDCNEMTSPVTPYLRAMDAINPLDQAFDNAVRAGITSVMAGPGSSNVVGGQFVFLKTHGKVVDDMVVKAPAAMKVAFGENPKGNYGGQNVMPSTRMSTASMLREELLCAHQYRTKKQSAAQKGELFEINYQKECWLPVLEGEIPLKAHAHRADDISTAIRIAKEYGLSMTLDHCTEGHLIADMVQKSGFPAIVGPSIASRNKIEVQFMNFKTAGILHKAGVKVAITTDHPVSLIQYLPICAGLAAREGLGCEEALRAITVNAAEICGVSERVGRIRPGMDADIAIFDGNPMEVFTKTLCTIIDGRVVYQFDDRASE